MNHFYYIDKKSEKTLIFLQGGPALCNFMDTTIEKDQINPVFWMYTDLVRTVPNLFESYNIAALNQEQYKINKNIIISPEESISFVNHTLQTLEATIKHFKDLGHQIVLLGHSYGGYLLSEYLKQYGNDQVLKIVIANSRIQTPSLLPDFIIEENKMPFLDINDNAIGFRTPKSGLQNTNSILAHLMQQDYTKELNHLDLSNVVYLTSSPDKWLGILQKNEILWAESKGAKVVSSDPKYLKEFKEAVNFNMSDDTLAHNTIFFKLIVEKIKKFIA